MNTMLTAILVESNDTDKGVIIGDTVTTKSGKELVLTGFIGNYSDPTDQGKVYVKKIGSKSTAMSHKFFPSVFGLEIVWIDQYGREH